MYYLRQCETQFDISCCKDQNCFWCAASWSIVKLVASINTACQVSTHRAMKWQKQWVTSACGWKKNKVREIRRIENKDEKERLRREKTEKDEFYSPVWGWQRSTEGAWGLWDLVFSPSGFLLPSLSSTSLFLFPPSISIYFSTPCFFPVSFALSFYSIQYTSRNEWY